MEALYWSLALTDQLNLGSAIIKVETSLSTGLMSDPQGQMIDLRLNAEWTGPPATQQGKAWHDRQLREKIGVEGCLVLQYADYIQPGKWKTKWLGPFQVQSFL